MTLSDTGEHYITRDKQIMPTLIRAQFKGWSCDQDLFYRIFDCGGNDFAGTGNNLSKKPTALGPESGSHSLIIKDRAKPPLLSFMNLITSEEHSAQGFPSEKGSTNYSAGAKTISNH